MFVRRPSGLAFLLATGLAIALPSVAVAAPTETPAPTSSVSAPAATEEHRVEVKQATVDQPKSRFDTAWVILPTGERGAFSIKTDYGFNQNYAEAPYGVFPPPAGGWEPGKSYRVEVRYASGSSGVVQVKLPVNAEDPGITGTISGPDAKGALTVQLAGVPVGDEVLVELYAGKIVSGIASDGGRATSTSPSYRLTPADGWKKGQTYIVMAMVGSQQPMGSYRWVQSFTYDGSAAKPGKPTTQPAPPGAKDRSGGLARTGW